MVVGRQIYEDILERGLELLHAPHGDATVLEQRAQPGFLPLAVKGEVQRLSKERGAADAGLSTHDLHRAHWCVGVDRDRTAAQPALQLGRRIECRELAF